MKYILAISGGVDSVVLLDMATQWPKAELVVAHFDHGIRADSSADADFVARLARHYGLPFVSERAMLGASASEEKARHARYSFLQRVAHEQQAQLVTAHHKDDVLETILLNLERGTGWRGLASLRSDRRVYRPFLPYDKIDLIAYAERQALEWREDATNQDTRYRRNYIRHQVVPRLSPSQRQWLFVTYQRQVALRSRIEDELQSILTSTQKAKNEYRRYFFIMADPTVAGEVLQAALKAAGGQSALRSQLAAALLAVKTFAPGKVYQMNGRARLRFSRDSVIVEVDQN